MATDQVWALLDDAAGSSGEPSHPGIPSAEPSPALADPVTPCPGVEPAPAPLAWLQEVLRQAIEEVMTSEAAPVQKAGAVTRLGTLYLKAYGMTELEKAHQELKK